MTKKTVIMQHKNGDRGKIDARHHSKG